MLAYRGTASRRVHQCPGKRHFLAARRRREEVRLERRRVRYLASNVLVDDDQRLAACTSAWKSGSDRYRCSIRVCSSGAARPRSIPPVAPHRPVSVSSRPEDPFLVGMARIDSRFTPCIPWTTTVPCSASRSARVFTRIRSARILGAARAESRAVRPAAFCSQPSRQCRPDHKQAESDSDPSAIGSRGSARRQSRRCSFNCRSDICSCRR